MEVNGCGSLENCNTNFNTNTGTYNSIGITNTTTITTTNTSTNNSPDTNLEAANLNADDDHPNNADFDCEDIYRTQHNLTAAALIKHDAKGNINLTKKYVQNEMMKRLFSSTIVKRKSLRPITKPNTQLQHFTLNSDIDYSDTLIKNIQKVYLNLSD